MLWFRRLYKAIRVVVIPLCGGIPLAIFIVLVVPQVANFDYINEEDALAAAEEAEREGQAKLEADIVSQGKGQFWDDLLKDKVVEQQQIEELEELGKGKRSRRQVRYLFATRLMNFPVCVEV